MTSATLTRRIEALERDLLPPLPPDHGDDDVTIFICERPDDTERYPGSDALRRWLSEHPCRPDCTGYRTVYWSAVRGFWDVRDQD